MNKQALFSIITVVFNNENGIRRTIESVISQTMYEEIEYIIIDGGSSDSTLNIVNEYKNVISHLVSEPDRGVYDAMNKGLCLASGEYVCFMNSGDEFYSKDVLCKIKNLKPKENDISAMYGDHILRDHIDGKLLNTIKCDSISNLWKKMCFSHQSFFVRLSWHKNNLFYVDNMAADHSLIYQCSQQFNIVYLDFTVSIYETGGISDKQLLRSTYNRYQYLFKYSNENKVLLSGYYIALITYLAIKNKYKQLYDK